MTDKLEGISSKSQEALASYAKHVTDSKEKKDNVNLSEGDNEEKVDFGESEDDLLSSQELEDLVKEVGVEMNVS